MKKIIFIFTVFASLANVMAQIKVDSAGNVGIGRDPQYKLDVLGNIRATGNIYMDNAASFLGTTKSSSPVIFRVNNIVAGVTGDSINGDVSFGYNAFPLRGYPNLWDGANTAIGSYSLFSSTGGGANTAIGSGSLYSSNRSSDNTAVGYASLYNCVTSHLNTAIGSMSLYSIDWGYENTAVGYASLYSIVGGGTSNTAIGSKSLYSKTSGYGNTAIGSGSLYNNISGDSNTAIGNESLYLNEYGYDNTAIGSMSLWGVTEGGSNTAIGANTDIYGSNPYNTTVIGAYAYATGDNQVRIGNSYVASIGGYANWSNISDKRVKKNIRPDVPGLAFINSLQPVTYNVDLEAADKLLGIDEKRKSNSDSLPAEIKNKLKAAREVKQKQVQTGFIAQDVEKTAKKLGYEFSGVDVDESGIYALRYAEFVVPLVKAVQELSGQNDLLKEQVRELTGLVNRLLGKEDAFAFRSEDSTAGLQESAAAGASLEQNIPNPFSQATVVRYSLPQTCSSAQIIIVNALGSVVRQIPLSGGTNSITVEGGSLQAGVYLYSLICDGNVIDTKRMVLTK